MNPIIFLFEHTSEQIGRGNEENLRTALQQLQYTVHLIRLFFRQDILRLIPLTEGTARYVRVEQA